MKKNIFALGIASLLFTLPSCKKEYACRCTSYGGTVTWQGSVEATSKAAAEKTLKEDCQGETVSCD